MSRKIQKDKLIYWKGMNKNINAWELKLSLESIYGPYGQYEVYI